MAGNNTINLAKIRFCGKGGGGGGVAGTIHLATISFAGRGQTGEIDDYNLDFNQDFRAPLPEE